MLESRRERRTAAWVYDQSSSGPDSEVDTNPTTPASYSGNTTPDTQTSYGLGTSTLAAEPHELRTALEHAVIYNRQRIDRERAEEDTRLAKEALSQMLNEPLEGILSSMPAQDRLKYLTDLDNRE
jgi:hypothetical protein